MFPLELQDSSEGVEFVCQGPIVGEAEGWGSVPDCRDSYAYILVCPLQKLVSRGSAQEAHIPSQEYTHANRMPCHHGNIELRKECSGFPGENGWDGLEWNGRGFPPRLGYWSLTTNTSVRRLVSAQLKVLSVQPN
jgi:hypothetical protein